MHNVRKCAENEAVLQTVHLSPTFWLCSQIDNPDCSTTSYIRWHTCADIQTCVNAIMLWSWNIFGCEKSQVVHMLYSKCRDKFCIQTTLHKNMYIWLLSDNMERIVIHKTHVFQTPVFLGMEFYVLKLKPDRQMTNTCNTLEGFRTSTPLTL
jgi:hypothetical protein